MGSLERRLLISYIGTVAAVVAAFALVVHLSFVTILERRVTEKLETLARAGTAAILFTNNGYKVYLGGFDVDQTTEGLEWFDANKVRILSRGRVPNRFISPDPGRSANPTKGGMLQTYTLPLRMPNGMLIGYVRASETAI